MKISSGNFESCGPAMILLMIIALSTALVGCNTTNPKKGGFFGGIGGLAGGDYSRGVGEKQQALSDAQRQDANQTQRKLVLENEAKRTRGRVARQQAEVDALEADIYRVRTKIDVLAARENSAKGRLRTLHGQISEAEAALRAMRRKRVTSAADGAERIRLKKEIAELEREVNILTAMGG